jgi:hypothetical protein
MEGVTPYDKMELHAEFDSYKEFELVLEKYQKEHFVQLWKRDSHEWKKSQIFNRDECKNLFLPFLTMFTFRP